MPLRWVHALEPALLSFLPPLCLFPRSLSPSPPNPPLPPYSSSSSFSVSPQHHPCSPSPLLLVFYSSLSSSICSELEAPTIFFLFLFLFFLSPFATCRPLQLCLFGGKGGRRLPATGRPPLCCRSLRNGVGGRRLGGRGGGRVGATPRLPPHAVDGGPRSPPRQPVGRGRTPPPPPVPPFHPRRPRPWAPPPPPASAAVAAATYHLPRPPPRLVPHNICGVPRIHPAAPRSGWRATACPGRPTNVSPHAHCPGLLHLRPSRALPVSSPQHAEMTRAGATLPL